MNKLGFAVALLMISACNGPTSEASEAVAERPAATPSNQAARTAPPSDQKVVPSTNPSISPALNATELAGNWDIIKFHSGGIGSWKNDDQMIIGKQIIVSSDSGSSLNMRWNNPQDTEFDQSEQCVGLNLSDAATPLPAEVPTIMAKATKGWGGADMSSIRLIGCTQGRFGPANADEFYAAIVRLNDGRVAIQSYNGDVFLLQKAGNAPRPRG